MRKFSLLMTVVLFTGCGEVVPPGKKVILLHPNGSSEVIEKGVYKAWGRTKSYFVDGKMKSFTEEMQILCADDINMGFDLKVLVSFDASQESVDFIKEKVPAILNEDGDMELSLEKFYGMAVKDVLRGTTRNVVSVYITDDIRPNRGIIEADLNEKARARLKELKFPITVSLLVSNIEYPKVVTDARRAIKNAQLEDQRRAALAEAELAEQQRQVAVEEERAKVRMVKAQAQADENAILTGSLTAPFLMWRQLEVMENVAIGLAKSPSNTVFMMPYQTMSPDMLNTAVLKESFQKDKKIIAQPIEKQKQELHLIQ